MGANTHHHPPATPAALHCLALAGAAHDLIDGAGTPRVLGVI